ALVAEEQTIPIGIPNIPETLLGFGREQPQALRAKRTRAKGRPVGMLVDIKRTPVVHPGAAQVPVGDLESQWMNQMKTRARQRTHPTDIAGVLRDLRIEEHDVQHARNLETSQK